MKTVSSSARGFTLVEIMIVVGIVGLLSALAIPALLHAKGRSQDTLALNTLRQLYDAQERFFTEDGAGRKSVKVPELVKQGYASHALDVATQHDIGAWDTSVLRVTTLKPGTPLSISEKFYSGRRVTRGRSMTYPAPQ